MFIVVEARIDVRLSELETRASSIVLRASASIRASSPLTLIINVIGIQTG